MRIGFCCKLVHPGGDATEEKRLNVRTTTLAALRRLGRLDAQRKLIAVVEHNLAALEGQIRFVASRPPLERMLRITSDLFPAYTHPLGDWVYREPPLSHRIADEMARIGAMAHRAGVRLSLHPGQYCVLNSTDAAVRANAVIDIEYHVDILRFMGHAGGWHPHGAHINIHVGGRVGGIEGFRRTLPCLSQEARDLLTVENDEISFGLDDVLPLADSLPIVLDLHHHWIKSGGEYLEPEDPRIERVRASWRGIRPVLHLSLSREDLLAGHPPGERPDFVHLQQRGLRPASLRAHSDRMWNEAVNDWAFGHLAWADIEVEAKAKNLAADDLARHVGRMLVVAPAGVR